MRLTDIMSGAGLTTYAVIAMILFLVAFLAIVVRLFAPGRRAELESKKHIPFTDGERAAPRTNGGRR